VQVKQRALQIGTAGLLCLGVGTAAIGKYAKATPASAPTASSETIAPASVATEPADAPALDRPFRLQQLLPESISETTDINAWGWGEYLHDGNHDNPPYWVGDLSLGLTQRIGSRASATADVHFYDDNDYKHGWVEQAFLTLELSERSETLLTMGKFNADFGVEPRNAWDRLGGTTGLLFGAQPQDLVGVMLTEPIGSGDVKLRPFLSANFNGDSEVKHPPLAGLLAEYRPNDNLRIAFTNLIGPGFKPEQDASADDEQQAAGDSSGSESLSQSDSQEYAASHRTYVIWNWTGPHIHGERDGTLYFADFSARWNPRPDLTLGAEALLAMTGHTADHIGWYGFTALANYDINDRWRVFGRWSYLNDAEGMITGVDETTQELSGGIGFQIVRGVELRTEYRHDFARSGDLDSLSAHLTFSF
jgi:hypothetical protein